jgi:hypothetical protein
MQNWAETNFLSPYGNQGGGGDPPEPWWRDQLDFRRSMFRRTPEAEYPDGYLGTIRTRRDDKLLDSLKNRVTQRSYQRGVHKGERIDPGDYLWPAQWQPDRGLAIEATGMRQAPVGQITDRQSPAGLGLYPRGFGSLGAAGSGPAIIDPKRVAQLQRMMPSWR